jgi:hypothetical protein
MKRQHVPLRRWQASEKSIAKKAVLVHKFLIIFGAARGGGLSFKRGEEVI